MAAFLMMEGLIVGVFSALDGILFYTLKCSMKNICCLIFHLKLPFPLLKNRQFVSPPITYSFRVKILKSI
jgi:hypothetical protein